MLGQHLSLVEEVFPAGLRQTCMCHCHQETCLSTKVSQVCVQAEFQEAPQGKDVCSTECPTSEKIFHYVVNAIRARQKPVHRLAVHIFFWAKRIEVEFVLSIIFMNGSHILYVLSSYDTMYYKTCLLVNVCKNRILDVGSWTCMLCLQTLWLWCHWRHLSQGRRNLFHTAAAQLWYHQLLNPSLR